MTAPTRPRIGQRLRAWMFEGDLPEGPLPWLWTSLGARILSLAAMRFHRDRCQEKAASLAYATLLALLPVLVLAVSLLEFLAPSEQMDFVRRFIEMVFPKAATELRDGVTSYIEQSREALIGSASAGRGLRIAGAVLLLYFAANLISGVDRVVGDVWGTGGIRVFMRRLTAYWAVATIGPLLLVLSILGTSLIGTLIPALGVFLATLVPFLVTWISAFAFFRLMPHTGAKTSAAVTGAVVAGTLWEVTKIAMGWYLGMPKSLLTALSFFPAAILWMYLSWAILIYGMEVTYVVHHGSWRPGRRAGRRTLTGRARAELILGIAVAVARDFDAGRTPDRARLAELLAVGEEEVQVAVHVLIDGGIVVADDEGGFRPARGAAGISALDVVRLARGDSLTSDASPSRDFLDSLEATGDPPAADVSLHDLVQRGTDETGAASTAAAARRPDGA